MKSLKLGMGTSLIVALVIGMGLAINDRANFFRSYYTIALPISLTAGALGYFISLACEDIISRSSTSDKDKNE